MLAACFIVSQAAHHDFKLKMYHPEYIYFFNLTKMCTQIKPAAANGDGNFLVMPKGQMR